MMAISAMLFGQFPGNHKLLDECEIEYVPREGDSIWHGEDEFIVHRVDHRWHTSEQRDTYGKTLVCTIYVREI